VPRRLVVGLLATVMLLVVSAAAQAANGRPLRSVDGRRTSNGWSVELRFEQPLRYMGRSPDGAAEVVRIELRTFGLGQADETPIVEGRVDRPFDPKSGPPIDSLTVMRAADENGLFIEIQFSRATPFEIRQESDLQRLEIVIPDADAVGAPRYEAAAASLLKTAKQSMADHEYAHAAQLYTRVLSMNAPGAHPEALEMLGLARERGGQRAHAKAEYERFLEQYPDHEHARRVRQRLQALATATGAAPEPLSPARRSRDGTRVDLHGSLLSYYSRGQGFLSDGIGSRVYDSSWFTDLAVRGRVRTERLEVAASAAGRTRLDFRDGGIGSDSRLTDLLVEVAERGRGWWGNVGRQRGDGGVIGRFDGARVGYRATDRLEFQVLGGFPLESYASDEINTDRFQVGAAGRALDVGSLFDVEVYGNYQNEAEMTYRGAMGTEIRHLRSGRTLVARLDYDAFFNVVNLATLIANEQITDALSLNGVIEFRKAPIVTMGNALIGQPVGSLEELQASYTDAEIKQLAKDRSSNATRFSAGARYDFTDSLDMSGSFTASHLGGTTASGGVPGLPDTGYEFGYYAQFGLRGLIMERDSTLFALRIFDGARANRYALEATGRYPVWRRLRVNPILRLEYEHSAADYIRLVPRVRVDYAWRQLYFDLDFAWDWTQGVGSSERPTEHGYSLAFGVRYVF